MNMRIIFIIQRKVAYLVEVRQDHMVNYFGGFILH